VLLIIDQAEELFGYSDAEAAKRADRFLRLLRATLEQSDQQFMAMATMRSDFLGTFQTHPFLLDPSYQQPFAYDEVTIDPMAEERFREVVRGPAERAGLRIDDDLVDRMVHDTGTRDALPLLAFTLRRLWDSETARSDNWFMLHEYEALGGLEGALRTAADEALDKERRTREELDQLHAAFVPTMVRVNAEGKTARRLAYRDEMPGAMRSLHDRFVNQRILITDRDQDGRETIELAHEALLRTWPQLKDWLEEDRDKLRLFESLRRSAAEWVERGRSDDALVHRNGRLRDVLDLIREPRFVPKKNSLEEAYLVACQAAQAAREAAAREEQERRVRDAERPRAKQLHSK
jgi:hypothetical protein